MTCSRAVGLLALGLGLLVAGRSDGADRWGLKPGAVQLTSAGALAFGPDGILFVGDSMGAKLYAIATDDTTGDPASAKITVENLQTVLATALDAPAADIKINDLAVNPASGKVYLSLAVGKSAQATLVRIDSPTKVTKLALSDAKHAVVEIADAPESKEGGRRGNPRAETITDLAYHEGKLFVSGMTKNAAPSTVREFTFPFSDRATATNLEIYHAAHGKVENNAAVRAFVPFIINGEATLLAGFTCTPLVKFPVKALEPGKQVRGTTVAELGNWNRPLDMIVYKQDGKSFVLMANSARGVMKISTDKIQENPGLNERVPNGGTAGQAFETIQDLKGVEQLDKLNDDQAVILVKAEKEAKYDLRTIALP